ncbi:phosphoglycolate phosphatase [Advenella kashmirensis W13003]|uniref:Phosphoglycolate phosphatase n=1 Tax=Advenella kashmirensis W13003 TaxID=1424334 RepID=V8QUU6_9BURK|nr:phosphoglycolate phosphatase [Advenella kashmirensis]ETF03118.1 phosphoglycolate phosphatase [Advenella kashmirensis W13003]
MSIQAALLDLDGTLVDSIPDLARAANAMRIKLGLPPLHQELIAQFVGKGIDHLVRRAMTGGDNDASVTDEAFIVAREHFVDAYHQVNGDHATVFEGVIDGLKAMKTAGIRLAVVTNKPSVFTEQLLIQTGLRSFFDAVVSGDTCPTKKPDPGPVLHACSLLNAEPADCIFIGDSINDALAAQAAGMPVLVVPYGYNEGNSVQNLKVNDIVESVVEAAEWIERHNAAIDPA